ncbi:MAG: class I SAM-dependent methyltransferase [Nannocystales bacterium]
MTTRAEKRQAALERLLKRGTTDHYIDAALYDFEYGERTDDIRWYRKLAREHLGEGGHIAELGAGTGRITCPLARDGHQLEAVDLMPSMLQGLRARMDEADLADRVSVHEADMRDLPLQDSSVELVIAPFNALMHLYTWRDLLTCFEEAFRVLAPSGKFAFDVQLPDIEWLLWDPDERHAATRFTHPETGEVEIYSTNHRYDHATQICHICLYYDEPPPKGRRFQPPPKPKRLVRLAHRQIYPEEIRALAGVAGFEVTRHEGDFRGRALDAASESQTVVCTKPSGAAG